MTRCTLVTADKITPSVSRIIRDFDYIIKRNFLPLVIHKKLTLLWAYKLLK
jgi:hypothetical protein